MEKQSNEYIISIYSLPEDVFTSILQNVGVCDIISFGTTCKWFNSMINSDQSLWRKKLKHMIPDTLFKLIAECCHGDWLNEIKEFHKLRKYIYSELESMPHTHYGCSKELTMNDVKKFFNLALSSKINYYLTIYILEEVIKKAKVNLEKCEIKEPYTLTGMYYAHSVLSHLRHSFLAVKWIEYTQNANLPPPPPEFVLNFFLQWVDTTITYSEENVENNIQERVRNVERILNNKSSNSDTIQERLAKGLLSEAQVLTAVSEVIYGSKHLSVTNTANLDVLNILKVFKFGCTSTIAVAIIYQAIARQCGVHCKIIAFPQHFFLEWTDKRGPSNSSAYNINLNNGQWQRKNRCPFAQAAHGTNYSYSPDFLLEYINATFHETMGVLRNWAVSNADHLRAFMNIDRENNNPYRKFRGFLLTKKNCLQDPHLPYNINSLSDVHMDIVRALLNNQKNVEVGRKHCVVKHRERQVKYAVGMICYHKLYEYVCVIQDWELVSPIEWEIQGHDSFHPMYVVIAADQSKRYVVQKNLINMARPTRLYHLEEALGDQFSHFDGFAYVPNSAKSKEYPRDIYIAKAYRKRLASA